MSKGLLWTSAYVFGIGPTELITLAIVLIIFGPRILSKIGKAIGSDTREPTSGKSRNMENREIVNEQNKTAEQKYNKSAIIGLVLSIIAVFGVGLAGIVGFILGIVALTQIKHTHEKGKGLAIAAIIVGFIWGFVVDILELLVEAGF